MRTIARRVVLTVVSVAMLFASEKHACGQNMTYGIDNERDSVAYAAFRCRMDSIRNHRPTVALVLSGGGAKGAAQIGVLKAIDRAGIPIDLVVGTSIGGLLGGLYACGYSGNELEGIIRMLDWDYLLRDSHPRAYDNIRKKTYDQQFELSASFGRSDSGGRRKIGSDLMRSGIVGGQNIYNLFSSLLVGYEDERNFLELPIPFACVAADMVTAQPKVWHCGKLTDALRSTMSVTGLFTPVRQNGMVLMDGGLMCNFPAGIAHRLGADIIIGVDISGAALDADNIKTLIDIVYQTTDVLGRQSYNEALEATTVYVRPEVSDFSLLSFSRESIDTIIERGRVAAEQCEAKVDSLRYLVGSGSVSRGRRAINTMQRSVEVSDILFNGVSDQEAAYLRKLAGLKTAVSRDVLDNAVATIVGTEAYERVTYSILGEAEPYTVVFNCVHSPSNRIGLSARYDNVDFASLLLHVGLNANKVTGWHFDANARLGLNTRMSLAAMYRTSRVVDLGAELSMLMVRNGSFKSGDYNFRINFMQGRTDLYLSLTPLRMLTMRAGVRLDAFYLSSLLADYTLTNLSFPYVNPSSVYVTAYASVAADSFDDYYFPTQGVQYSLDYQYHVMNMLDNLGPFGSLYGNIKVAVGRNRVTFIPFAEIRLQNVMATPYVNILALPHSFRFLDHQVSFVGITHPTSALNNVESVGVSVLWSITKKHYLTHTSQYLRASSEVLAAGENHVGFSVGYAYRAIIGQLRADLCWSDIGKVPGLLVSLGLDF